jgi:diaminopimelate decarboxylase
MVITYQILEAISAKHGQSFYLLDSKKFAGNFKKLLQAFRAIYPKTHIAYSYKTNYIPRLCKLVDQLGGFAEVVSDLEYKIALRLSVKPENIYFNGPYKNAAAVEELLLAGGTVNLDSSHDLKIVKDIAERYPQKALSIGVRCNFDLLDGVVSRFGFDVDGEEFKAAVNTVREVPNLNLNGLHCHFATRSIETWPRRAAGMLKLVKQYFVQPPLFISLGGGLFGGMEDSLKAQFDVEIPSYQDYAAAAAPSIKAFYKNLALSRQPMLIIEPGTALVADAMKFVAKVVSIKKIRGKNIATLSGSIYNINPTLHSKNPPIKIYHDRKSKARRIDYEDLDFGGYTCIESDYLYRGYNGKLAVSDYVVFSDIGSYSVVLKPPFILPNCAVIDYDSEPGETEVVKREENFEDLFHTYSF